MPAQVQTVIIYIILGPIRLGPGSYTFVLIRCPKVDISPGTYFKSTLRS